MNQIKAFENTILLAERVGMPDDGERRHAAVPQNTGLNHLRDMFARIEIGFSPAKLGRWLGYAQGCLAANADGAVLLEDVKAINEAQADKGTPSYKELCERLELSSDHDSKTAAEAIRYLTMGMEAAVQFGAHATAINERLRPDDLGQRVAEHIFKMMHAGGFSDGLLSEDDIRRVKDEIADIVKQECEHV